MAGSLQVDSITNSAGTGPVSFPQGLTVLSAPNYFSGYMVAQWSTTSSSFVDPTIVSGSNTLTTIYTKGMTVTAGASNVVGVTWTPTSTTAAYWISYTAVFANTASTDQALAVITDGTTQIGGLSQSTSANNGYMSGTFSGIYAPATASAVTLKIQLNAQGNTAKIYYTSPNFSSVNFSILQLSN